MSTFVSENMGLITQDGLLPCINVESLTFSGEGLSTSFTVNPTLGFCLDFVELQQEVPVFTTKKIFTLSNGNYLVYGHGLGSSPNYGWWGCYDSNDNKYVWTGSSLSYVESSGHYYSGLIVGYVDGGSSPIVATFTSEHGTFTDFHFHLSGNSKNEYTAWLGNSYTQIPQYVWTAWDQIAGNSGQYRCNLTMIKNASIGDFSTIQYGDSTDFNRISSQASLMNIFHNMSYGVEQKVAWSGSNYLTMELATVTGLPNQVDLIFRFYIPASSSSAVYTQSQRMTWDGTYRDKNIYLSFVHDDEQQAAILLPVLDNYYTSQYSWGWSGGTPSSDDMLYVWLWLQASGSPQSDSPYSTGTTDNGGTPGGPTPQDQIQTPSAPSLDGTSSGMFTIYCPDDTELQHIASFLWDSSTISSIHKYFNNFSDNIISLYVLPYKGTNLPSKVFTVGNLSSSDTDLSSVEYVTSRFVKLDMGSVTIKPFWDSYLDYSPYSKMEIYLPGCGVQQIDVDDIMCPTLQDGSLPTPEGSTISLEYMVDLMTGIMVAFININGELRYQFPGKIGYSIPLTGENHASLVRGYITATAGLIGMAVTGGAAAPFAAGAAAAGIINAMKPDVYRGGNLSGDASMLSYRTPYLIYRRPNKPLLTDQEKFTGFPSYKIDTLSNFSGYTEVIDCHVEGISCTDEEREKILAALKGGVII